MGEWLDVEAWRAVGVRALSELGENLAGFLPGLLGAALLLLVGWALSRALEAAAVRTLRALGMDRAAGRLGVGDALVRAGVDAAPSRIAGRLVFWLLMLTFLLSAVEALGLTAVTATIDRLIAYIPSVIGAGLIALLGMLLARFVGGLVASAASAAGLPSSARLGFAARAAVVVLVFAAAVEQLGVSTQVLVAPLTAAVAAGAITAGLAFALGARPIVTHVLAGHFLRQVLPQGASIAFEGRSGVVERVGATETLVRGPERRWSVPNARLLEQVVDR